MNNAEILRHCTTDLIVECINKQDSQLVPKFYHPEVVFHNGPDEAFHGHDAIISVIEQFKAAFPNLNYSIEDLIVQEDKVVLRWKADTGAANLPLIPGITIFRFQDELVIEVWQEWDRSLIQAAG